MSQNDPNATGPQPPDGGSNPTDVSSVPIVPVSNGEGKCPDCHATVTGERHWCLPKKDWVENGAEAPAVPDGHPEALKFPNGSSIPFATIDAEIRRSERESVIARLEALKWSDDTPDGVTRLTVNGTLNWAINRLTATGPQERGSALLEETKVVGAALAARDRRWRDKIETLAREQEAIIEGVSDDRIILVYKARAVLLRSLLSGTEQDCPNALCPDIHVPCPSCSVEGEGEREECRCVSGGGPVYRAECPKHSGESPGKPVPEVDDLEGRLNILRDSYADDNGNFSRDNGFVANGIDAAIDLVRESALKDVANGKTKEQ